MIRIDGKDQHVRERLARHVDLQIDHRVVLVNLFNAIFDVPLEWNNYAKVILTFNIQAHRRLVDYVVFHPKIFDRISVVS